MILFLLSFLLSFSIKSAQLEAAKVVEHYERFEIDWSSLKVRSFGIASPSTRADASAKSVSYSALQSEALEEGLSYISRAFPDYVHKNLFPEAQLTEYSALQTGNSGFNLAKRTYYFATEFHQDMAIKLLLESSLAAAFSSPRLNSELPSNQNVRQELDIDSHTHTATGIVLHLSRETQPVPTYQLLDEHGSILLEARMIDAASFSANLMGRWYKAPAGPPMQRYVGNSPVSLSVRVQKRGIYQVKAAEWGRVLKTLRHQLARSRIALVIPG